MGVVVDSTGSMGDDIDAVKTEVHTIVGEVRGTDRAPSQYLLETFNDPDVGTPFTTSDADAFLAAVDGLSADGGGDCPEYAETGLLRAIAACQPNSSLYTFTDASAKDSSLGPSVAAAAKRQSVTVTHFLTGSCSPIDPSYLLVSEETGGQVFMLDRYAGEVYKVFELVRPQLAGDIATLLSARAMLAGDTREYSVPVDSSVTNVTFSVSLDSLDEATVVRPTGEAVTAGDPDATITPLARGAVIAIQSPAVGQWLFRVRGSGDAWVNVRANTSLQFTRFEFVQRDGPRHEGGLFPIAGQPLLTTPQIARANVVGAVGHVSFKLVDESGGDTVPINLALGDPDAAQGTADPDPPAGGWPGGSAIGR